MPVVRELKTEEVLLRFQKQESRPLTCLDTADYMSALKHIKLGSTLDKKESGS